MRTSGVADLAGRVLAGRYRLVAPLGTGASGRVYAAWDVKLQRKVAVKVLHAAVADFGLARALAEASWTEPAGAVLGTARYAAPEQVRGLVDARSDVYSLALVLVEAVSGAVPFAADTSLATLLARVERHLEAPPELDAVAPVLERAGQADPAGRYPDARSFAAALADAARHLPAPDPIP